MEIKIQSTHNHIVGNQNKIDSQENRTNLKKNESSTYKSQETYDENNSVITNVLNKKIEETKSVNKAELKKQDIEEVAQQLQEFVASLNSNISFSVHEESGKNIISVTDKITGDLIRQIPSEEVLELASRISKAAGLFIKKQV